MFFNVRGIRLTLLAILVVGLLCALDVHCSNVRDEKASGAGTLSRVKSELGAGRQAVAFQRADQLAAQIRDLRVLAKHLVRKGEMRRARATISLIQELEEQRLRLQKE